MMSIASLGTAGHKRRGAGTGAAGGAEGAEVEEEELIVIYIQTHRKRQGKNVKSKKS